MQFSIITPSFRSANWLPLCVASVADQGVELEHIVQDSCSDDGTQEWLRSDPRVTAVIEKDDGMYDAINRGLRRARGEILAYLNCDEQYLPGALSSVATYFAANPHVDVLFADAIVIDEHGEFVCYRKTLLPREEHVLVSHLPTFTAATFFRRDILDRGFLFDPKYRASGDADWVCRMLRAGVRMAVLRRYVAAFTDTGENMALNSRALHENEQLRASAPGWAQKLAFAIVLHHRIRRLTGGIYSQSPFDYSVYTCASQSARVEHHVARPTFLWNSRLGGATRLFARLRTGR